MALHDDFSTVGTGNSHIHRRNNTTPATWDSPFGFDGHVFGRGLQFYLALRVDIIGQVA